MRMIKRKKPVEKLDLTQITKGDKSQYECKTNTALNAINQESIRDTSKWNKVDFEQILNIGKEMCGNKKLEHKQQWMTEEIYTTKIDGDVHQISPKPLPLEP